MLALHDPSPPSPTGLYAVLLQALELPNHSSDALPHPALEASWLPNMPTAALFSLFPAHALLAISSSVFGYHALNHLLG